MNLLARRLDDSGLTHGRPRFETQRAVAPDFATYFDDEVEGGGYPIPEGVEALKRGGKVGRRRRRPRRPITDPRLTVKQFWASLPPDARVRAQRGFLPRDSGWLQPVFSGLPGGAATSHAVNITNQWAPPPAAASQPSAAPPPALAAVAPTTPGWVLADDDVPKAPDFDFPDDERKATLPRREEPRTPPMRPQGALTPSLMDQILNRPALRPTKGLSALDALSSPARPTSHADLLADAVKAPKLRKKKDQVELKAPAAVAVTLADEIKASGGRPKKAKRPTKKQLAEAALIDGLPDLNAAPYAPGSIEAASSLASSAAEHAARITR
jgi:hypothetical protein